LAGKAEDLYGGERIRGEDFGVFLVGFLDDKGMSGEEDGDLLWVLAEIWWFMGRESKFNIKSGGGCSAPAEKEAFDTITLILSVLPP
jgi:hypothetical protein